MAKVFVLIQTYTKQDGKRANILAVLGSDPQLLSANANLSVVEADVSDWVIKVVIRNGYNRDIHYAFKHSKNEAEEYLSSVEFNREWANIDQSEIYPISQILSP